MRRHITTDSKVNEIRMLLNKKNYKNKTFVLLEGNTDIKLFRGLFESSKVQIESLDGKTNVESAVANLSKENKDRIIGICDADFDHVNNRETLSQILFLTDSHDSEMMMIGSPAIGSLISEYAKPAYYEGLERNLSKKSLEVCYEVGLVRWINCNENLEINFKGMNFESFLTVNNLNLIFCINSFLQNLIDNSPHIKIDKQKLLEKIKEYREKDACHFQVCSGHDLTKVISMILSQDHVGIFPINPGRVESSLRLAYSFSDFQKTNLHSKIVEWQSLFSKEVFAA